MDQILQHNLMLQDFSELHKDDMPSHKVRHSAKRGNEQLFEIALGELFCLASEAFTERNKLRSQIKSLAQQVKDLKLEVKSLRDNKG